MRGFTLIELMVTVVVLAVLLSLAAPSFSNVVRDQRVKAATFDVYASLVFARSEAIKRNANIDIIPAAVGDWSAGWRIEAAGTVLKRQDAHQGLNISGPGGADIATLTYQGDGRLTAAPTFVVSSPESASITARCVRVDLSGRPNIKVDTDKNIANGCQ